MPNPELASAHDPRRDDRKSAKLAERNAKLESGTELVRSFALARGILRSAYALQDGHGAEQVNVGNPDHLPVFYLDGERHRERRAALKGFFTPAAVVNRYRPVMERATDDLLARLRASGTARLDEIAFELAVAVAAEIVGLTESGARPMANRLSHLLKAAFSGRTGWGPVGLFNRIGRAYWGYRFLVNDVRPAVRARATQRRDDVISQTLDKGYSERAIMVECLTYGTAGMLTTREFIVMVAWHLFDRPALRDRFLAATDEGQLLILQEILRLEPVAGFVQRRAAEDFEAASQSLRAGSHFTIDLRAANTDESAVGACPHMLDPDRAARLGENGTFMSFGDGTHRCPGWQVALHETRVFIDRLLRVPGIRMEREPDMTWNPIVSGYELRNAIVACSRGL
jgi:cytochrome P450